MALKALDLTALLRFQPEPPDTPAATVFIHKAITAAQWNAAYSELLAGKGTPEEKSFNFQLKLLCAAVVRVENYNGEAEVKGPFPEESEFWKTLHHTVWEMLVSEIMLANSLSVDDKKKLPVLESGSTKPTTEGSRGSGTVPVTGVSLPLDASAEDVQAPQLNQ